MKDLPFLFDMCLFIAISSTFIDSLLLIIDIDLILSPSLSYRGAKIEEKVPGRVELFADEQGQSKFEN